jgi:o-succinylbenzoate synthase
MRLTPPLVTARGTWSERIGVGVSLHDGSGRPGRGEAWPLPGYSSDDVESCQRALTALAPTLLDELMSMDDPARLLDVVARAVPSESAARFALEAAALDRLGRKRELPVWRLLREVAGASTEAPSDVELAALLPSHDPAAAVAQARRHVAEGRRTFKLKLGPALPTPDQLATLEALRGEFAATIALRLDANASLGRSHLEESLQRLARYAPEFVEEPVDLAAIDPWLDAVLTSSSVPIAFDESLQRLREPALASALLAPYCDSVVLKPTTLGGFRGCLDLARRARAQGRAVVVSHTFEGPVGWLACVHLALALAPARAAGLWPRDEQCPAEWRGTFMRAGRLDAFERPGLGAEA